MTLSRPVYFRIYACLVLVALALSFVVLRFPLNWLLRHEIVKDAQDARGLQALPLYFMPYFFVQFLTGLSLYDLHHAWLRLPLWAKLLTFIALVGCAIGAVLAYLHFGLGHLWAGKWLENLE